MSFWRIAFRSIQQRLVASILTIISMGLGVTLVVSILSIHGVVAESFSNGTHTGYHMIVAATKGGKMQVTLNTVFYLSSPVENLPYDYYLEFVPPAERDRQYENSLQYAFHRAIWDSFRLAGLPAVLADPLEDDAASRWDYSVFVQPLVNQPVRPWRRHRPTKYGDLIEFAIPVGLGDYVGPYRVVATIPEFFERLRYGREQRPYRFSAGRNFRTHSAEHGYEEAVVGATVAADLGIRVGQTINPTHGATEEEGGTKHEHHFTVVGILAPSGTPNDRAVFVNLEGFYLMEDHAKPLARVLPRGQPAVSQQGEHEDEHDKGHETGHEKRHEHAGEDEHEDEHEKGAGHEHEKGHAGAHEHGHRHEHGERERPLPIEQREVTAILVKARSVAATMGMQNRIDEEDPAQAVLHNLEIFRLFDVFVRPIQQLLIALTAMICIVSGIGILVSIYNSMSDRRREIAVMRALGAERVTVMTIVLWEAVLLALAGGLLGWIAGHGLNWLASGLVEAKTGVQIGFFSFAPGPRLLEFTWGGQHYGWVVSSETLIIPALIGLAVLVGLVPAIAAYRTDVAAALGE